MPPSRRRNRRAAQRRPDHRPERHDRHRGELCERGSRPRVSACDPRRGRALRRQPPSVAEKLAALRKRPGRCCNVPRHKVTGKARSARVARRMLAIALVLEGVDRETAAETCGMDRQSLRDWMHRYNVEGLPVWTTAAHRARRELDLGHLKGASHLDATEVGAKIGPHHLVVVARMKMISAPACALARNACTTSLCVWGQCQPRRRLQPSNTSPTS